MIKQFLFLAAALLACAACSSEDETGSVSAETGYIGTMSVVSLSQEGSYSFDHKNFDLAQNSDNKIALWMYDTQFVPMMPKMTMIVPGLETHGSGDRFTLTGDEITPYRKDGDDMLEMDKSRLVTDFAGTVDKQAGTLEVSFVCMGFQVTYNGTLIKK